VFLDKLELANSKMGTALQARRDGLGFCQQSKTKSHEISAADRGLRYQIASLHGEGGTERDSFWSFICWLVVSRYRYFIFANLFDS